MATVTNEVEAKSLDSVSARMGRPKSSLASPAGDLGPRPRTRASRPVFTWLHAGVILLALAPAAKLVIDGFSGGLGANPIEELTHRTGWWTLTFLMLTLAVTPLRRLTGWGRLIKLRRTLGLFAFFYAGLHFAVYIGLDQLFAFDFILEDIAERPYITVGFTALLLLVPLAATSTKRMVRRLGGKRWNRLHKLVHVAAALGVLHFLWLVKADVREPTIFAIILVSLLGYRLMAGRRRGRARPTSA